MYRSICVLGSVIFFLFGCSDPYKHEIPSDGRITPAEAKRIVESLPEEDAVVFDRWVKRSVSGERFAAEPGAPNVRAAIANQIEFEHKKKEELEQDRLKEREKQAEAERLKSQRAVAEKAAMQLLAQRQQVDLAIRQLFDVNLTGYVLENVFSPLGSVIGQQWRFSMRLKNRMSSADVVGMAGWVTISDVFGNEFGSIPFKLEPFVKAGKEMSFDAVLPFDRNNQSHVEMASTTNIRSRFFLESLALGNGQTVDRNSLGAAIEKSVQKKNEAGGT